MQEPEIVQPKRPRADTDRSCPDCGRYQGGHLVHSIQARMAAESPWGWRDGIVATITGRFVLVDYVFVAGSVWCWHHVGLSGELRTGDAVRVHERFRLVHGPMGVVCVKLGRDLEPVPDPEHRELSRPENTPMIVNLATGRGIVVPPSGPGPGSPGARSPNGG